MASLQVRHQRGCALGKPWTTAAPKALEGCSCSPTFNVVSRVDGKLEREKVGTDREKAEKRLDRINFHIEENDYQPPTHERFRQFAARWLEGLDGRSTTAESYRYTIAYANEVFPRKRVSALVVSDVAKLLAHIKREHPKMSSSTRAKHLRQLGTILEAAVREDVLRKNPCKQLDKSRRPQATSSEASYFTNAELARLWPELAARPVYLALCKVAVTTGMRFGELAGLRWSDVRLLDGELDVRRQWTHGQEVDRPKSRKRRVIHLVRAAKALLEEWYTETGDEGLVFENETGGHLDNSRARKVLYAAMKRAGIERIGEGGGERTFHSFRHTFARIALENGTSIQWVKDELGHSSIKLTVDLYGSWSQEASKVAAGRLEGAFTV